MVLWIVRFLYVLSCAEGPDSVVAFFLTAHFSQEDYPYDWYDVALASPCRRLLTFGSRLMHWLAKVGLVLRLQDIP